MDLKEIYRNLEVAGLWSPMIFRVGVPPPVFTIRSSVHRSRTFPLGSLCVNCQLSSVQKPCWLMISSKILLTNILGIIWDYSNLNQPAWYSMMEWHRDFLNTAQLPIAPMVQDSPSKRQKCEMCSLTRAIRLHKPRKMYWSLLIADS